MPINITAEDAVRVTVSGAPGAAGAAGATGATGATGPAPSGTGLVSVTSGVLDTPSTLAAHITADAVNLRSALGLGSLATQNGDFASKAGVDGDGINATLFKDALGTSSGSVSNNDEGLLVRYGENNVIAGGSIFDFAVIGNHDIGAIYSHSETGTAGYFHASEGTAVIGDSDGQAGVRGKAGTGVGGKFSSGSGPYAATFASGDTEVSAVARVRGWFVWFYGLFTGTLKTADITANREWTLPDASGTLALTTSTVSGVTGLSITSGKTLSATNTLTLAGTDSSTLNIGTGGTLGTAAYTSSGSYVLASQLSQVGGASKVLQLDSSGNLTTGAYANGAGGTAFAHPGNIAIPDQQGVRWMNPSTGAFTAQIRHWFGHDASGGEMLIESPWRIAIINYNTLQVGSNATARDGMSLRMTSGGATVTDTLRNSKALMFTTSCWTAGASVGAYVGLQGLALDTSSTNALGVFIGGDSVQGGGSTAGNLDGTKVAQFDATGMKISSGLALTFGDATTLTSSASLVTLTGSQTLTNKTLTSPIISAINGGTAANDDITIQGTSHATKATSYVNLQPSGGKVGIGTTAPDKVLEVNLGTSDAFRLSYSDSDGTATHRLDTTLDSSGQTTWTQTGPFMNMVGTGYTRFGLFAGSGAGPTLATFSGGAYLVGLYFSPSKTIEWQDAGSTTRIYTDMTTGSMGFGMSGAPSARLHAISTTEPMRLGYDASNYYKTTVSSTGAVTLDAVGSGASFTVADPLIAGAQIRLKSYTVATLPTGTAGDTAFVTDALTPTYLGMLVGGGAVVTPVFYNGTAWVSH